MSKLPHNRKVRRRRGTAVVECAVVLPVFVLIILGTIEACSMIFLQQSLEIAAYEGARIAIVPESDSGNVEAACDSILSKRGVNGAVVDVSPADFPSAPYGQFIRVRVSAPCAANSLAGTWFYSGRTLVGEAQMMKER